MASDEERGKLHSSGVAFCKVSSENLSQRTDENYERY
jgi:hypothetical protein